MKLSKFLQTAYDYSETASNVSRQLAFAGIALIWIFKIQNSDLIAIPKELLFPAIALMISLGFDLLQYISGYIIWICFHRYNEKKHLNANLEIIEDPDITAPYWFHYPITVFYVLKLLFVLIAYGYLLKYCLSAIYFG